MAVLHVENKTAINNYHGITIYHIHKDNLAENPVCEFWYSLNPYCTEDSEDAFDIREAVYTGLSNRTITPEDSHARILCELIDAGYFGENDLVEREGGKVDERGADETTVEICPICGFNELAYGMSEDVDDQRYYKFSCPNCGAQGKEWHRLTFDGFEVE